MILIIAAVLALTCLAMGFYFVKISLYPETENYDETYRRELDNNYFDDGYYTGLEKVEVSIDSEFLYKLRGYWFPNKSSSRTIIIAHGYTVNLCASIRYLKMFHDRGFNILIYDQRYHGKSGGPNCTMGYYEKYDLKTCVSWVISETGEGSIVGIHGESMGASTALMHAAIDNRISFVISDCAFQNLHKQFAYRLKAEYRLPAFPLLSFANLATKIVTNQFYRNISPISEIDKVKIPVLFIHGDSDTYTLCSNTIDLYEKKKGIKELYLCRGANHAESLYVNRSEYERVVDNFINSLKMY